VNRYNGDVVCCTKTRLPYVYTRHAGWRRLITVYHCIIHSVLVRSRCRITGSIAWWQVDDWRRMETGNQLSDEWENWHASLQSICVAWFHWSCCAARPPRAQPNSRLGPNQTRLRLTSRQLVSSTPDPIMTSSWRSVYRQWLTVWHVSKPCRQWRRAAAMGLLARWLSDTSINDVDSSAHRSPIN